MARTYIKIADCASASHPEATPHIVKADAETGFLSCDCGSWVYNTERKDPRQCRHTRGVAGHPHIAPYVNRATLVMNRDGLEKWATADSDTPNVTAIVAAARAQRTVRPAPTARQQAAARTVTTGAALATQQAERLTGFTYVDLQGAARQHGVSMSESQARAIVMTLRRQDESATVAASVAGFDEATYVTRRILLD